MNSKRERRPNVRLWEIGDFPAAFACSLSPRNTGNLGQKRFKLDSVNSYRDEIGSVKQCYNNGSSKLLISKTGVSPRISIDSLQYTENKNLNFSKLGSESDKSHEIGIARSGLNFEGINRKSRIMRWRGQSSKGIHGTYINEVDCPSISKLDANLCHGDINETYGSKEYEPLALNPATRTAAFEDGIEEPLSDAEWPCDDCSDEEEDGLFDKGKNAGVSGDECDHTEAGFSVCDVNSVSMWLEDLGFGKYVDIFEMHEVDEETLPLLTLEDLKEMGVFAVGPRRKLFTAITKLRNRDARA